MYDEEKLTSVPETEPDNCVAEEEAAENNWAEEAKKIPGLVSQRRG